MRHVVGFAGALLLAAIAVSSVRSGADNDLYALILKAIKVRGGEENHAKYKALVMKGTGTFYGLGEGIPWTGEWHMQGQAQMRFALELKAMDNSLTLTKIINGDKGWAKFNDQVKVMSADEVAEEKHDMYARWVSSLLPLKDKAFKLAALGEVKVAEKPAVGVRVSHDGKRDISLFFDKASALVLKNEYQVKDVAGGADKDVLQETFYADFKEFKGTQYPTKITIKRDGKQFVDASLTEIRPTEAVDEALFAKP